MCGEVLKSKIAFQEGPCMRHTPKLLREMLDSMIRKMGEHPDQYVRQPGRDFTRPRTLTFETVISLLLTMSENSIGKVLIGRFQNSEKTPSASAFVQQRQKLLPAALETLFHRFTALLRPEKTFCGCRLLAVDGSSLKSAACPEDPASYRPGTPRQHGWNLWHMNALFDLENGIYTDLIVQKEHEKNECRALCQMAERSRIFGKVILLADRNYESCNNLAHLEKRNWRWYFPFPLTERSAAQVLRAKPLSAEKKVKKNFRAAGNDKNRPAGHRPTGRVAQYNLLYLYCIV